MLLASPHHLFKAQKHVILSSGFLKGQWLSAITESKTELKLKQISLSLQFSTTLSNFFFFFGVNFVIHWNEKALGSHVNDNSQQLLYCHLGPCYTEILGGSMPNEWTHQSTHVSIFNHSQTLKHRRTTHYRYDFLKIRSNIKQNDSNVWKPCCLLKRIPIGTLRDQMSGFCFATSQLWKLGTNHPFTDLLHLVELWATELSAEVEM